MMRPSIHPNTFTVYDNSSEGRTHSQYLPQSQYNPTVYNNGSEGRTHY